MDVRASEKADLVEGEHREAVTTSWRKWSGEERGGGRLSSEEIEMFHLT